MLFRSAFVYLDEKDVVRHELVQRIIQAYERYDASQQLKRSNEAGSDANEVSA